MQTEKRRFATALVNDSNKNLKAPLEIPRENSQMQGIAIYTTCNSLVSRLKSGRL